MSTPDAPSERYLPTLVVDSNSAAAILLAGHLSHSGFHADVATSYPTAQVAARARRYGVFVVVADLSQVDNRDGIARLRAQAPHTWLIVINSDLYPEEHEVTLQCGADVLVTVPFSVKDLTSRLAGFSGRPRLP
jgi:DNA-binding response OmpR family regulator